MVLVNSGFKHTRRNFSENCPQFEHEHHEHSKNFASPVLDRKSSKNNGVKGPQIVNLPGAPTYLGPTLLCRIITIKQQLKRYGFA